jgi:hypothetical protein
MLKGDLASTPLAPLLLHLAEDLATGCLHVSDPEGDEALIYFKNGLVYAISVPGRRPQLGAKLVSSGALAPEALSDALEAQRTELKGWRLGELLVHLGYVDQPVVEDFIKEQVHDAIWDLIKWVDGRWRFRKAEKTREDVAPPMEVAELLHELRERGAEWANISSIVHGPTAVPVLSTRGGGSTETRLDADAWSMLCKIDGERSLAELARDCGYTHFEAGQILVALVNAGLVDIDEDLDAEPLTSLAGIPQEELYGATSVSSALVADAEASTASYESEPEDSYAALARLVSEVAASVRDDNSAREDSEPEPEPAPVVSLDQTRARFNAGNDQSFAASIAKVSAALNDVLGPAPATAPDPFEVPMDLRTPTMPRARTEDEERRTRARQAAAAELAAAHALAEALRSAQPEGTSATVDTHAAVAEVVDLAAVRREAEAERLAATEAARLEAERVEAERLEAERVEAERLAAEEAARLEAERAEAERVEAERLAAEEAARLEAERLEAERLEAERVAAEEAARREAEEAAERRRERRAAREAARREAERVEAERLEAERVAAEEAARLEAERVEAERVEAERLEAERVEAERVAAEEAARLEAERVEAERVAAEETARLEAERVEAERVAAEEAARLEAVRLAAEEAARLEAERVAVELAEAESEAWAEYWARQTRAADAAAEATSLLVSLAAEPLAEPTPEPEPEVEPEPVADDNEPAEVREPAAVGGRGSGMYDMADTAALLRELSSLGVEDDDSPSPPASPSAPRQVRPAAPEKKKKRGLFGF